MDSWLQLLGLVLLLVSQVVGVAFLFGRMTAGHEAITKEVAGVKDEMRGIKEQVKITNGRVSTLEQWRAYERGRVGLSMEERTR